MSTASTSAAPASSAGPTSGQSSPSGDNSVADHQSSTRNESGAASSNPPKQNQQAKQPDDDPEWDFGNGRKAKRSEVQKRFSEVTKGAQKANEEAKQYKARVEALDARLRKLGLDPEAFEDDEKAGALLDKISQERIARKLEEATLDPAERERRDLKAENERLKKEHEARVEEQRQNEHKQQVEANADAIAGHFATALKEHGLPVNAKSVWLMASLLQGARRSGKQISLSELARMTDQTVKGDLRHYLPKGDVNALKSFLGDDWSEWKEAIRKDLLAEHEAKFTPQPKQSTRPEPKQAVKSSHPSGYWTLDDLRQAEARRRR